MFQRFAGAPESSFRRLSRARPKRITSPSIALLPIGRVSDVLTAQECKTAAAGLDGYPERPVALMMELPSMSVAVVEADPDLATDGASGAIQPCERRRRHRPPSSRPRHAVDPGQTRQYTNRTACSPRSASLSGPHPGSVRPRDSSNRTSREIRPGDPFERCASHRLAVTA
jgi:hypothetical protein